MPKYDFNWQLDYFLKEPHKVPAGTKVRVVARFDNSADNIYNPDPTKSVKWGEQTWEEMMMGGIFLSWNDGQITLPEVEVEATSEKDLMTANMMIKQFDKDADGLVQKTEVPEQMQQFFGMIDSNADGGLDANELLTVVKMRR